MKTEIDFKKIADTPKEYQTLALVEELTSLRCDSLHEFFELLSSRMTREALHIREKKPELAARLLSLVETLHESEYHAMSAWGIQKKDPPPPPAPPPVRTSSATLI